MSNILKLILLWNICIVAGVVALLWMFLAIPFSNGRAWRIAVGFDQLANATFGGDEDETISARCWRYREDPKYSALVQVINMLANDKNHCRDSYLSEQDDRAMRKMRRAIGV